MPTNLNGKVALLVGGGKGIGRETARGLARLGATVVIVGRDPINGAALVQELETLGGSARFIPADVSLMAEVRRLAETFKRQYVRLDILIYTADVLRMERADTREGQEVSFATNFLSRFLLNALLLDLLKASAPARIIHVAAAGMPGKLKPEQFPPPAKASSFQAHNLGQRANDVYGVEMAARLKGSGVTINIMNPGLVDTDIRRQAQTSGIMGLVLPKIEALLSRLATKPEQFARLVLKLATDQEYERVSGALFNAKGKVLSVPSGKIDEAIRDHVWKTSQQLTNFTPAMVSSSPLETTVN